MWNLYTHLTWAVEHGKVPVDAISIKSLRTSLPGKLRLAPDAPDPGYHALLLLLYYYHYCGISSRHGRSMGVHVQEGWRMAVAKRAKDELASREAALRTLLQQERDKQLQVCCCSHHSLS